MAQPTRKREKRSVPRGKVYIQATFNNTIVTIADNSGNVLSWSTAGHMNFRGARKSTPYAAQMAARDAVSKARDYGIKEVDVLLKGPGIGRESAVRTIANEGIHVRSIKDVTPLPHNGCRPRKKRRV